MNLTEPPLYTVSGFCEAHHIARSFLYTLLREGRGPRVIKLGRRTFITREAAAEWRTRLEQETIAPGEEGEATLRNAGDPGPAE